MADFDKVAEIYDATRSLDPLLMRKIVLTISKHLGGARSLLDVGVGTGRYAEPLGRMGFDIVGVDISRRMITKARDKTVPNLILADAKHLPFPDGAFESALIVHFIHLVDDWVQVLHEVGRVVRRELVSVIEYSTALGFRDIYIRLRNQKGLPTNRFDGGERGLVELLAPTRRETLTTYTDEVDADKEIQHYEQRLSSATWGVLDDAHAGIIRRMEELYKGTRIPRRQTVTLVTWSRNQLLGYEGRNTKRDPSP